MKFDSARVMTHVQSFAFPRTSGSEGERSAAGMMAEQLEEAGWRVEQQVVRSGSRASSFLVTEAIFLLLLGFWLWLAVRASAPGMPRPARIALVGGALTGLVMLAVAAIGRAGLRTLRERLRCECGSTTSRTHSLNVVCGWPEGGESPARVLILTRLVAPVRRCRWREWIGVVILALFWLAIRAGLPKFWVDWGFVAFSVAALIGCGRFWLRQGPTAPGDNRSGLGLLTEIARSLPPRLHESLEIRLAAVGGDVVDRWGALSLAEVVRRQWPAKPTLVINLDAPGLGKELVLFGRGEGQVLAEKAASDLWLPHRVVRWSFRALDHRPFAVNGFPALSLAGDRNGPRVDPASLAATGQLVTELALRWSKQAAPAAQGGVTLSRSSQNPG